MNNHLNNFISTIVVSGSILFSSVLPSEAQIIPDTTLPNNTSIKIEENTTKIEGGTQMENNLFHSFKEFSIPIGIF
ncbi:MAG: filamentous hemagglutinin N-terminal domain-containing protein [Komarekiella atlantica HA4396-MV6]|jgi:large exoprotein involved in heme utilization and adhesion|nr:filamentous hemagglutinin N-terminal domain-containing protein [Komarekiella atlantica HA4396-MV6]